MHSTASNNRYRDHRGHTHHVKGTKGGQQGDGLEMMRYSLSQHPIMGRVFARHRNARGVGFADDLNMYASLKTALKVLVEMRQRLGEDTKLSFCLVPNGRHGSARTCSLHCTLTPAACAARSARSVPGQDTRSGQGALARRHTDGPLWAALLKTTVMCEAWRRRTIAPPDPCRTAERPNPILLITGSSIPIPVPGLYRLSRCLK
jgi:hypothetical protein